MAHEPEPIPIHESRPRPPLEIRVRGVLGPTLLEAFPTLTARTQGQDTVLSATLADQSELYGVLRELEALGLTLLELRALPTGGPPPSAARAGGHTLRAARRFAGQPLTAEKEHFMTDQPTEDHESPSDGDRWAQGLDAYASQFQIPRDQVAQWFSQTVGERFGREAIYSAAQAWSDDELSLRVRSLVVLAALITMGGAEQQLRVHTRWALDHGCTQAEIEAMAALLAVYAGFARAANGLILIREELTKLAGRSSTTA